MEILHRHGPGYCAKCPSRENCVALCSRAEAYAGQDYVESKEETISAVTSTQHGNNLNRWRAYA
jgi:hypothetical protein